MYIDLSVPHCARKQREYTDYYYFSELLSRGEIFFQKCLYCVRSGLLNIYTYHSGGFLVHKHKTRTFDAVGERPHTQSISKSAQQTKKSRKLSWSQETAIIFWSFPNRKWREPYDFPIGIEVFFMQMVSTPGDLKWCWGERESRLNKDRRKTLDHR